MLTSCLAYIHLSSACFLCGQSFDCTHAGYPQPKRYGLGKSCTGLWKCSLTFPAGRERALWIKSLPEFTTRFLYLCKLSLCNERTLHVENALDLPAVKQAPKLYCHTFYFHFYCSAKLRIRNFHRKFIF